MRRALDGCTLSAVIVRVDLSRRVRKQLQKVPRHIVENLAAWVDDVETRGLEAARRTPGYHDEPLHGAREGQRSVRLSRSYRAMYIVKVEGTVEFVSVEEISKHEY